MSLVISKLVYLTSSIVSFLLCEYSSIYIFSENAKAEGKRLEAEANQAKEVKVGPFTITCHSYPTMIDGKMKMHWTGTNR